MIRFPEISDSEFDADQVAMAQKAQRSGPFQAFLRAPLLWQALQPLRLYLAKASSLDDSVREAAMLAIARELRATAGFAGHVALAQRAGLSNEDIARIGAGEIPDDDRAAVAAECSLSLLRAHAIDPALYARARALFGEQGVLDIIGLTGFFSTICLTLNVAEIDGEAPFTPATASYSPSGQS